MEEHTQSKTKTMISIQNLHKSYGKKDVLLGLNLDVYEGELFGFIGRNGVGKSTTIDCMIGAKKFSLGSITLDEFDVTKNPLEAKSMYGYVASEPTCYEEMTGYDYLEFIASIYQMNEGDFRRNTEYLCHRLQLKLEELSNPIGDYSHGMKQKLCLVASLIHSPKIWILDEPTVGLDPKQITEIRELIKELGKTHTIIFSSHILSEVSQICNKVIIINKGKIVAIDTPENLEKKVNNNNTVYVTVEDLEQKMDSIKDKIEEIKDVKLVKENEDGTKQYVIEANGDTDLRKVIFSEFAKENITIFEMKKADITLEDAFMQLIEGGEK